MGIISISTKSNVEIPEQHVHQKPLARMLKVSNGEVFNNHGIPIVEAPIQNFVLKYLRFGCVEMIALALHNVRLDAENINKNIRKLRHNWSGFMQQLMV